MAKKRPKISTHIQEGGQGLAEIMREKLTIIADDLVKQIMGKAKRLIPSQKLQALKDLNPHGTNDYKDSVRTALAVMALDAIDHARKEIPRAKRVRLCENEDSTTLAEFDRLPPSLKKKIKTQTDLLVGKQIGDLQKVIEFAYVTSEEETDSNEQIESELDHSAIEWLDSAALGAGAELNAAKIINSARNAFFTEPDVLSEIEALQFNNGDPLTPVCQDLAGTVFAKDDPSADQFFPPLHWNCKSFITPVLIGNLEEALKKAGQEGLESLAPSKKSLEDNIQFYEQFNKPCQDHSH